MVARRTPRSRLPWADTDRVALSLTVRTSVNNDGQRILPFHAKRVGVRDWGSAARCVPVVRPRGVLSSSFFIPSEPEVPTGMLPVGRLRAVAVPANAGDALREGTTEQAPPEPRFPRSRAFELPSAIQTATRRRTVGAWVAGLDERGEFAERSDAIGRR